MYLKLKRWLTGFDWLAGGSDAVKSAQISPSLDYHDIAFQLAAAGDISEVLPDVLSRLQTQLNAQLPARQCVRLLTLICRPVSAESWLHHAQQDSLPPQLSQNLHHHFTSQKTSNRQLLNLTVDNHQLNLLPWRLTEDVQQQVWLLYLFNNDIPNLQQLQWKTAPLETTLSKGINAWSQNQAKIRTAVENERAAYAAELHDSLAQILGFLKIKSAKLDKLCQRPPHQELKTISEDLATYTQCAYHQTRELIISSRLTLQSDNLSQAVTDAVHEFEQQSAIVFELDNRLPAQTLSAKSAMQLLYIIRESLSNIVRHSHATHASIRLFIKSDDLLQVDIEDNGSGIDSAAARHDSFGLKIMHERAERIGATLTIGDAEPHGTRVTLTLNTGASQ